MTRARDVANIDGLLTTTGDTYYASAAGTPARLGVGTTGQVMTVAAGVPSWATAATPASGMVFLNRTTFSNVANVDIDYFSSSYYNYIVVIERIYAATASDDMWMQLRAAGVTDTSAMYYCATQQLNYAGLTATLLSSAATKFQLFLDNGSTYVGTRAFLHFNQVGNSSELASFNGTWQSGDIAATGFIGGSTANANTWTGFRLLSASTNITGAVSVYGLAKA
jgi:hypothetical protein